MSCCRLWQQSTRHTNRTSSAPAHIIVLSFVRKRYLPLDTYTLLALLRLSQISHKTNNSGILAPPFFIYTCARMCRVTFVDVGDLQPEAVFRYFYPRTKVQVRSRSSYEKGYWYIVLIFLFYIMYGVSAM